MAAIGSVFIATLCCGCAQQPDESFSTDTQSASPLDFVYPLGDTFDYAVDSMMQCQLSLTRVYASCSGESEKNNVLASTGMALQHFRTELDGVGEGTQTQAIEPASADQQYQTLLLNQVTLLNRIGRKKVWSRLQISSGFPITNGAPINADALALRMVELVPPDYCGERAKTTRNIYEQRMRELANRYSRYVRPSLVGHCGYGASVEFDVSACGSAAAD